MSRYLVTGGAGFIGSRLVVKLLKFSNVVVLDNLSTGSIINEDAEFIHGDITDAEVYSKIGKVDGIFHMAAMSKVLPSLGDPKMVDFCNYNNVNGTINVLKFAASFTPPIKVIYSASSTCYGLNDIPNVETQLPDCQSPYALSKYIGELYCGLFSRLYQVPTVRLRYFMVFGPGEPSTGSYAIVTGIFNKNKKENKPLCIHGDGSQTRDFVHVDDVAEANVRAMESDLDNNTIYVGTGEMTSIKELADMISDNQVFANSRKNDLKHTQADCSEIERLLNWKPRISIKNILLNCMIVVARFNEDVSWINSFKKCRTIVYDKSDNPIHGSVPLPNIERELGSFLEFIIENYDCLPDHTVFMQGRPWDHMRYNTGNLEDDIINSLSEVSKPLLIDLYHENHDYYPGLQVVRHYKEIFAGDLPATFSFAAGCQYSVPKNNLLFRPKEFYIKLKNMLHKYPYGNTCIASFSDEYDTSWICPWALERLIGYVFDGKTEIN